MSANTHLNRIPSRGACLALALLIVLPSACSVLNREGPDVTCADLRAGEINACEDGIIAACDDGSHVSYRVCDSKDTCGESWQVDGLYRCEESVVCGMTINFWPDDDKELNASCRACLMKKCCVQTRSCAASGDCCRTVTMSEWSDDEGVLLDCVRDSCAGCSLSLTSRCGE